MRHFKVKNTAYVLFEPEEEELLRIAGEAGFQAEIQRHERALLISLIPKEPRMMLFDAADRRQAARLALARTFASGPTGVVYNTPFVLEAATDARVAVRIATEVRWDTARKFPQGPSESSVLSLFQQLVQDLATGMVGLCGAPAQGLATARSSP